MTDLRLDQRGVIAGLLSLSRNLGLVTGASAMGAVFTFASALILVALAVGLGSQIRITSKLDSGGNCYK